MKILRIENLCKIYGKDETKVNALNNISFDVDEGEFIAVIGPSGSGKSTLLHTIAGLEKPTSGSVYFYDKSIYGMKPKDLTILRREKIGIIYQFYNLIPTLTVKENITLPLELDRKEVDENKLNNILKFLNIENRVNHLPNELSGGQQQKVAIARALIINPTIILADEPTGNLDINSSNEIIKLLKKANKEYNQTIIMITHNLDIAKEYIQEKDAIDNIYMTSEFYSEPEIIAILSHMDFVISGRMHLDIATMRAGSIPIAYNANNGSFKEIEKFYGMYSLCYGNTDLIAINQEELILLIQKLANKENRLALLNKYTEFAEMVRGLCTM